MEASSTSETSVNFYQIIRRNIPEDIHHLNRNLGISNVFIWTSSIACKEFLNYIKISQRFEGWLFLRHRVQMKKPYSV
jgi:hypothetical protein